MNFLVSVVSLVQLHLVTVQAWGTAHRRVTPLGMVATADVATKPKAKTSDRPLSITGHDQEAWENAYTTCPKEIPPTVVPFPDLPSDFPVGTYYRNGHARFESDDGIRVKHMFDGDGMISAHTFEQKRMLFRNRFVRTAGYRDDQKTGQMSAPGTFGTRVSGGFWKNLARTDFKNVANTHVLYTNGVLYALWEGGWPYKLDPLTLENDVVEEPRGTDLDGLLKEGDAFAAHYRTDPRSNTIVGFGVTLNPVKRNTRISLYELDSNMKSIRSDEVSAILDGTCLAHDYGLTENWHIFSLPPAKLDTLAALKALLGQGAFAGVVGFDNDADQAQLVLIPRRKNLKEGTAKEMKIGEDSRIKIINVPFHFSFHTANAFEDKDGNITVDMTLSSKAVVRG